MNCNTVFQVAENMGFRSHVEVIDYNTIPDTDLLNLLHLVQIQKWLRHEHKIDLVFDVWESGNWERKYCVTVKKPHNKHLSNFFHTYEEALLQGIHKALEFKEKCSLNKIAI